VIGCACWGCMGGGSVCKDSRLRKQAEQASPDNATTLAEFGGDTVEEAARYLADEFGVARVILDKMRAHFKRKTAR